MPEQAAFDDTFVDAYSTTTGRKQRVPRHFIGHPVLGAGLALTPSARGRDEEAEPDVLVEVPAGDPTDDWTRAQLDAYAATLLDLDTAPMRNKADVLAAIQDATAPADPTELDTDAVETGSAEAVQQ